MTRSAIFSFVLAGITLAAVACTSSSDPEEGSVSEDELRAANACKDKACGDSCSLCAGRPNCVETAVLKFCSGQGRCKAEQPTCSGGYKPCAGKACGDTCKICPPSDPSCVETQEVKACNAEGQCVSSVPACSSPDGGSYAPCAGKACGDACTVCPPNDPNCFETQEVKVCQKDGTCSGAAPACK